MNPIAYFLLGSYQLLYDSFDETQDNHESVESNPSTLTFIAHLAVVLLLKYGNSVD